MTQSQLYRISGLSLLLGAGAFVVHIVLRSIVTAGPDPVTVSEQNLWVPINTLGVIGAVLVLLGLPGMYARVARLAGVLGLTGVVLIAVAWLFFGVFLSLYALVVVPWLADNAPSLIASASRPSGFVVAFVAALIAWVVGTVCLAVPFSRRRVRPRWVGYVLFASALMMVIGNLVIAPGGPATNLSLNLLSNLGPVLLLVAFADLGCLTLLEQAPAGHAESRMLHSSR